MSLTTEDKKWIVARMRICVELIIGAICLLYVVEHW
jgi:hypothetical protein